MRQRNAPPLGGNQFSSNRTKAPFFAIALITISWAAAAGGQMPGKPVNTTPKLRFEVASIRPVARDQSVREFSISSPEEGQFTARNTSLTTLIYWAFDLTQERQLENKPKWLDWEIWDITAKPAEGTRPNSEELRGMVQQLLIERFGLTYNVRTEKAKGYILGIDEKGFKLEASKGGAGGMRGSWASGKTKATIYMRNGSLSDFAKTLGGVLREPVVDDTGLEGKFDITFSFAPTNTLGPADESYLPDDPSSTEPSIFSAIKTLGLDLTSGQVTLNVLHITSINNEATEN